MSVLYGIINLKNNTVPADYPAGMKESLRFHHADRHVEWNEDGFAGGVSHRFSTPESVSETYPLRDPEQIFVSEGRIDNREDLFSKLSLRTLLKETTDSMLMYESWRKWGKECVLHLCGDWCFAVYNKKDKNIFIARDHTGNTNIFYFASTEYFAFSNSIKAILALPFCPREINELKLASLLTIFRESAATTVFKNVFALPPGHWMEIKDGSVNTRQYWDPGTIAVNNNISDSDAFEQFREVFSQAVQGRIRSIRPVSIALSSGLDSGAVASVAAQELNKTGRTLETYTSVPCFDTGHSPQHRIHDESLLVKEYEKTFPNIRMNFVKSENYPVLSSLMNALDIFEEPLAFPSNNFWINDIFKRSSAENGVLLTGQCGNQTISWPFQSYAGRFTAPVHPDFSLSNFRSVSAFRINVLRPFIPGRILHLYSRLKNGKTPWRSISMISHSLEKRTSLAEHISQSGWYPPYTYPGSLHEGQVKHLDPAINHPGQYHVPLSQYFGISSLDPTMDIRLVKFCLSLPDSVYINHSQSRRLVREGLKDIIPDPILQNTRRGQQASDIILRLHHQQEELKQLQDEMRHSPAIGEYLDYSKMMKFIKTLITLKGIKQIDTYSFLRAVTVFYFLKRH